MTEVERGQESLSPDLFTPRQGEVLVLLVNGFTRKEIAEILRISLYTVGHHIDGVPDSLTERRRLGIKGIVERVRGERPGKKELIELFNHDVFLPLDTYQESQFAD